MRALVPLLLIAVAGCSVVEDHFGREKHVFAVEGKSVEIATQYDPIEFAWFSRATSAEVAFGLSPEDRDMVVGLVEKEIGEIYCDNDRMELAEFYEENLPGGANVVYLPSLGAYQIVSRCARDIPQELIDIAPRLPRVEDLPKLENTPRPSWLSFLDEV